MKIFHKITLASALLAVVMNPVYAAYNDADTDYSNLDSYSWYSKGPAAETTAMADFLLCVTSKSKIVENYGEKYSLLIDENVCYNKSGADGPKYGQMTIDATNQDTDLSSYHIDGWYKTHNGKQALTTIDTFASPTELAPMGVFTLRWQMLGSGVTSGFTFEQLPRGEMKFKADGTVSYFELSGHGGNYLVGYATGKIKSDLSAASMAFRSAAWDFALNSGAGGYDNRDYRYVYDVNNILWDQVDDSGNTVFESAVCSTRDSSKVVEHVMEYTLFKEDGSKLEAGLPFIFTYTDSSNGTSQGYVSGRGTWLENGETGATRPSQITKADDAKYNICYDDDDTKIGSCRSDVIDDGVYVYLTPVGAASAIVFTSPIKFEDIPLTNRTSTTAAVDAVSISFAGNIYVNGSSLMCSDGKGGWDAASDSKCRVQSDLRPTYTIKDGTQLTSGSTTYRIKAARTLNDFGVEPTLAECSALSLANAPAQITDRTALRKIQATGLQWRSKPTGRKLKYIGDVEELAGIVIGTQTWRASNVSLKPLRNKTYGKDYWDFYGGSSQARITADNDGWYYTYKAAMNVCPNGWHLPSQDEWGTLFNHLGSRGHPLFGPHDVGFKLHDAGFAPKAAGYVEFFPSSRGVRGSNKGRGRGSRSFWWTADEQPYQHSAAVAFSMTSAECERRREDRDWAPPGSACNVSRRHREKELLLNVRCVKDTG